MQSELKKFIKKTENSVSPKTVGGLYWRAEMLGKLPAKAQKYLIEKGAEKDPYLSFIVEPYSLFPAYEIIDVEAAKKYLPPDYELVPAAMFEGTEPRYCAILGMFSVHTSVFWGNRVELYVIAENKKTGMMSWIICDYESNTISYDPGQGFIGSTVERAIVATSYTGELVVDIVSKISPNQISLVANVLSGQQTPLFQRLWIEANMSVDYGGHLGEESKPFPLIFDPKEMVHALKIPLDEMTVERNTFGNGMFADTPFEICCFPFAQHFLTTSFPMERELRTGDDLVQAIKEFNDQ